MALLLSVCVCTAVVVLCGILLFDFSKLLKRLECSARSVSNINGNAIVIVKVKKGEYLMRIVKVFNNFFCQPFGRDSKSTCQMK